MAQVKNGFIGSMSQGSSKPRVVGIALFDRFELLDVFGPAEFFGLLKGHFNLLMIGPERGSVASAQGPKVIADVAFGEVSELDLILVPGGIGTRKQVENEEFLAWLKKISSQAEYVTSVCTGSALLARAGVLDGKRATSNKWALDWVMSQGPYVNWVKKARWVEHGKYWTSSGVSAGMDMGLALIGRLHGSQIADGVAKGTEYDRHVDPNWDPFAG